MIKVVAVGKKHESWVVDGIQRYERRLNKPYNVEWGFLPHSSLTGLAARQDESGRILSRLKDDDFVILLGEQGENIDSPALARKIETKQAHNKSIVVIIGGAYGVDSRVHQRADFVWSLSNLVFPHQLVRLILVEQFYRLQEINRGGSYHHQ